MSNPLVPGDPSQPSGAPTDDEVTSTPIGEEDVVMENEPSGATQSRGGGEFPDPDTPPSSMAPADGRSPEHGQGQFAQAYEEEAEGKHQGTGTATT